MKEDDKFCSACGTPVVAPVVEPERRVEREEKKPVSNLTIVLIVLVVVVVVVAVGVMTLFWILGGLWQGPWPVGQVVGSGKLVTEEMIYSDFTVVDVGNAFEVEITQSNSYSVSITADDNLFDYIQVSKTGETLDIGLKWGYNYRSSTLRAEITMPELYELRLSGATHGIVEGFSSSHKFILDLSGASSLDIVDLSAGDIEFDISGASLVTGGIMASGDAQFDVSGASRVDLKGAANDLLFDVSGASHLDLSNFPVHNANVELDGASQATINLDGRLDAELSGSSHLYYRGDPTLGNIEASSGSTVSKK